MRLRSFRWMLRFAAIIAAGVPGLCAVPGLFAADRAASLGAICGKLGIGEGMTAADVGCGNGQDSFTLAAVVGPRGTVFSEEIDEKLVRSVLTGARERKLAQIVPILGETEDPRFPDGSLDLVYMHYVYHHFAKPDSMLQNIRADLKPGGILLIVEKGGGVLKDWAPLDVREKEHHVLGETTVVRQVREAGFLFVDVLDGLWQEKGDFVLAFRKTAGAPAPEGDPDLPQPFDGLKALGALPLAATGADGVVQGGRPLTVGVAALDRGRDVLPALAGALPPGSRILDVVLEEWAASKTEVPPVPAGMKVEVIRTEGGRLEVPAGVAFDVFIFADAYHRLWDPGEILKGLRASLAPGGTIVILDRKDPGALERRAAGHFRRVAPALVLEEMGKAGFEKSLEPGAPAADRFVLVFKPKPGERWVRASSFPRSTTHR